MAREPWNGKPIKNGSWGTWAQIESVRNNYRQSCYTCVHCNDGECILYNVVISEIGGGFYKQCNSYLLDSFKLNHKTKNARLSRRKTDTKIPINKDYILTEKTKGRSAKKCIRITKKGKCKFFLSNCIGASTCKMYKETENENT